MSTAYSPPPGKSRVKTILIALGFVISAAAGAAGGLLFISWMDMPDMSRLDGYSASAGMKLYDNGAPPSLVSQLSIEQRTFVPFDRMPRRLLDAVVAIEDERFYSHWGMDFRGILRAALINVVRRRKAQGASTITMQLARTLFLSLDRTWKRKLTEAMLAIQIERTYKKEEILRMYLNQVYFGSGAYGVEQAARAYFGKHVEELTLPECALLAGLPQAPSQYSPRINAEAAIARRNMVLERMASNGFIDRREAELNMDAPIHLRQTEPTNAPYFSAHVSQMMEKNYGTQSVHHGGLNVYTTLDLRLQQIAQRSLETGIRHAEMLIHARKGLSTGGTLPLQGAMIAIEPKTGAILAMVGGRSFRKFQYNRAMQARRQPGSSFKPFIYTTALMNGWTASDIIDDSPQTFGDWTPPNYSKKFYGPTTLRHGLALSRNIVTVKLLDRVGVREAIKTAGNFGFAGPFRHDLTMALGTNEVSMLEMVSAFSVFANGGVRAEPFFVKMVKDSLGNVLQQHETRMDRVISAQIAYIMTDIMGDVLSYGTARNIRKSGFSWPAGGKTGTTDGFGDAWFIGFTPALVCGVWLGYDDNRTLGRHMAGGRIAAPIWASFMAEALEGKPKEEFDRPAGLVTAKVDAHSGLVAVRECEWVYEEIYLEGAAPTRKCDAHKLVKDITIVEYDELERIKQDHASATALEEMEDEIKIE